jgi:hypothetical protein
MKYEILIDESEGDFSARTDPEHGDQDVVRGGSA